MGNLYSYARTQTPELEKTAADLLLREEKYIADLSAIVSYFLLPLQRWADEQSAVKSSTVSAEILASAGPIADASVHGGDREGIVSRADIHVVFQKIEELLAFHKDLYNGMLSADGGTGVLKKLFQATPSQRLYESFLLNFPIAQERLQALESNPAFSSFVRSCEFNMTAALSPSSVKSIPPWAGARLRDLLWRPLDYISNLRYALSVAIGVVEDVGDTGGMAEVLLADLVRRVNSEIPREHISLQRLRVDHSITTSISTSIANTGAYCSRLGNLQVVTSAGWQTLRFALCGPILAYGTCSTAPPGVRRHTLHSTIFLNSGFTYVVEGGAMGSQPSFMVVSPQQSFVMKAADPVETDAWMVAIRGAITQASQAVNSTQHPDEEVGPKLMGIRALKTSFKNLRTKKDIKSTAGQPPSGIQPRPSITSKDELPPPPSHSSYVSPPLSALGAISSPRDPQKDFFSIGSNYSSNASAATTAVPSASTSVAGLSPRGGGLSGPRQFSFSSTLLESPLKFNIWIEVGAIEEAGTNVGKGVSACVDGEVVFMTYEIPPGGGGGGPPQTPSFWQVLHHPEGRFLLYRQLIEDMCSEPLLLWEAAESYALEHSALKASVSGWGIDPDTLKKRVAAVMDPKAKGIVATFIKQGAEQEVNVVASVRESTMKAVSAGSCSEEVFLPIVKDALHMLEQDGFKRFKAGRHFPPLQEALNREKVLAHAVRFEDLCAVDNLEASRGMDIQTPESIIPSQARLDAALEYLEANAGWDLPAVDSGEWLLKFSSSVEHFPACIVVSDCDGQLLTVNSQFCVSLGYTKVEVLGRTCKMLHGPKTKPESIKTMKDAMEKGSGCTLVVQNYRKNSSEPFPNLVSLKPISDVEGEKCFVIGVMMEVVNDDGLSVRMVQLVRLLELIPRRIQVGCHTPTSISMQAFQLAEFVGTQVSAPPVFVQRTSGTGSSLDYKDVGEDETGEAMERALSQVGASFGGEAAASAEEWLLRFRQSSEYFPCSICVGDALKEGCPLLFVNLQYTIMTGYSKAEAESQKLTTFLTGADTEPESLSAIICSISSSQESVTRITNYRKNGERFSNLLTTKPVSDSNGVVRYMIAVLFEMSDTRVGAQRSTSVKHLQKVLSLMPKSIAGSTKSQQKNKPTDQITRGRADSLLSALQAAKNVVSKQKDKNENGGYQHRVDAAQINEALSKLAFGLRNISDSENWMADFSSCVETFPGISIVVVNMKSGGCPLVSVSDQFLLTTGYTRAEVIGKNLRLLQGPGTEADSVNELRAAISTPRETTVLITNYTREGSKYQNCVSLKPVVDTNSKYCYMIGLLMEVVKDEGLKARVVQMERLIELLPSRIPAQAKDAQAGTGLFAPLSPGLLLPESLWESGSAQGRSDSMSSFAERDRMDTGGSFEFALDKLEQVAGWDEEASDSEAWLNRFALSAETFPACIVVANMCIGGCPMCYINKEFTRVTGYSKQEAVGRNCRFLQGPETEMERVDTMRKALAGGKEITVQLTNYKRNGVPFQNLLSMKPVYDANGVYRFVIGVQFEISTGGVAQPKQKKQLNRLLGMFPKRLKKGTANSASSSSLQVQMQLQSAAAITSRADSLIGSAGMLGFGAGLQDSSRSMRSVSTNSEVTVGDVSVGGGHNKTLRLETESSGTTLEQLTMAMVGVSESDDWLTSFSRAVNAYANVAIVVVDMRRGGAPIVSVNDHYVYMTGFSKEESLGSNCRKLQGPGTEQGGIAELRSAMSSASPCTVTLMNYKASGTRFKNRISIKPILDVHGNYCYNVGVLLEVPKEKEKDGTRFKTKIAEVDRILDLIPSRIKADARSIGNISSPASVNSVFSERDRADSAVSRGRLDTGGVDDALDKLEVMCGWEDETTDPDSWLARFAQSAETFPACIVVANMCVGGCPMCYVNKEFCRVTQYTKQEAVGQNCRFLQGRDTEEELVEIMRVALSAGEEVQVKLTNYKKNGEKFLNLLSMKPVFDANGVYRFVIGVQFEIVGGSKVQSKQRKQLDRLLGLMPKRLKRKTPVKGDVAAQIQKYEAITSRADGLIASSGFLAGNATPTAAATPTTAGSGASPVGYTDGRKTPPALPWRVGSPDKDNRRVSTNEQFSSSAVDNSLDRLALGMVSVANADDWLTAFSLAVLTYPGAAVVVTDVTKGGCPLVSVNNYFEQLTGYHKAEALNQSCRYLQGPASEPDAISELRTAIGVPRETVVQLINYRKDGSKFLNRVALKPVLDSNNKYCYCIGILMEVIKDEGLKGRISQVERLTKLMPSRVRTPMVNELSGSTVGARPAFSLINPTAAYSFRNRQDSARDSVGNSIASDVGFDWALDELEQVSQWDEEGAGDDSWLMRFAQSAESFPACIVVSDMLVGGCKMVYVNKEFCRVTKYSKQEVVGKNCRFLQGPDTEMELVDVMRTALAAGEEVQVQLTNYRKTGEPFQNLLSMKPVFDSNGTYRYVIGVQFEIVGGKSALPKQKKQLGRLLGLMPKRLQKKVNTPATKTSDVKAQLQKYEAITSRADSLIASSGYLPVAENTTNANIIAPVKETPPSSAGSSKGGFFNFLDRRPSSNVGRSSVSGPSPVKGDRKLFSGGSPRDPVVNAPVDTAAGEVGMALDKLALSLVAVADSPDWLTSFSEAVKDFPGTGIVVVDCRKAGAPVVSVNEYFTTMTGYSREESIGRNCRFLQGPATETIGITEMRAAMSTPRECTVALSNYRKSGEKFTNLITLRPVVDSANKYYIIGILQEICNDEGLKVRMLLMDRLIALMPKKIKYKVMQEGGRSTPQRPSFSNSTSPTGSIVGTPRGEFIRMSSSSPGGGESPSSAYGIERRGSEDSLDRFDSALDKLAEIGVWEDASGDAEVWLAKFAASAESFPAAIVVTDMQTGGCPLCFVNRHFCRITGYSKREAEGRNCKFLQGTETEEELVEVMRKALAGGNQCQVKITNYRKNGEKFTNLLSLKPVFDAQGVYRFSIGVQFELAGDNSATKQKKQLNKLLSLMPKKLRGGGESSEKNSNKRASALAVSAETAEAITGRADMLISSVGSVSDGRPPLSSQPSSRRNS